jgi:quinol-cytochrome oxidoreductase complex cytochrome b subunit
MSQVPEGQNPDSATDALGRARSGVLVALGVDVLVLTLSGIALFFVYRPTARQSWNDLFAGNTDSAARLSEVLRYVHLLASRLAVFTAVAAGMLVVLAKPPVARRWTAVAHGTGIAVTAVAASFTGFLLPWDQLALWAVTVGSNMSGYRPLFGPTVRFVLLGGAEVSRGTILLWLLVHMLVLGPLLAGLVLLAWLRPRVTSGRT